MTDQQLITLAAKSIQKDVQITKDNFSCTFKFKSKKLLADFTVELSIMGYELHNTIVVNENAYTIRI